MKGLVLWIYWAWCPDCGHRREVHTDKDPKFPLGTGTSESPITKICYDCDKKRGLKAIRKDWESGRLP